MTPVIAKYQTSGVNILPKCAVECSRGEELVYFENDFDYLKGSYITYDYTFGETMFYDSYFKERFSSNGIYSVSRYYDYR